MKKALIFCVSLMPFFNAFPAASKATRKPDMVDKIVKQIIKEAQERFALTFSIIYVEVTIAQDDAKKETIIFTMESSEPQIMTHLDVHNNLEKIIRVNVIKHVENHLTQSRQNAGLPQHKKIALDSLPIKIYPILGSKAKENLSEIKINYTCNVTV